MSIYDFKQYRNKATIKAIKFSELDPPKHLVKKVLYCDKTGHVAKHPSERNLEYEYKVMWALKSNGYLVPDGSYICIWPNGSMNVMNARVFESNWELDHVD